MKNIYVFLLCSCFLVSHCRSFSKREMKVTKVMELRLAISNKDTKLIESILKQNVSINSITNLGVIPIFYAARYGDIKTTTFFNSISHLGITPIFYAVRRGDIKTTAFLIRKGATVDVVTANGITLLMRSIGHWTLRQTFDYDEKIVKYLLDHGLKKMIHYKDNMGHTALLYACLYGTPNMVKWLLEAGADPNDTVAWSGNIPFVKKIYSALDLVKFNKTPGDGIRIKRLLIQYGAKE